MIKPTSDGGVTSIGISPIRGSSKHQMTPIRTRRKTSRKDQATDVHATCSTPTHSQSENPSIPFSSPSDFYPYSQDNRPDVVWDYTSPKLPMGAKKKEIKITVDEFLKSLSHNQAPECNTQNSQYIKLLEKWMAKQNTPVCVTKPKRTVKRDNKLRSRRVFEQMKQFMESIQQNNEGKSKDNERKEGSVESNLPTSENLAESSASINRKSFLEGDNDENDSLEELWGDADNSFIVKATQHLDVSCLKYNAQNKNLELVSTIPETASNVLKITKNINDETVPSTGNIILSNKAFLDADHQAQMLLTQIMSCDWDSGSDNGDLENGFIMGDEDLSLIPDEVLRGVDDNQNKKHERTPPNIPEQKCDNKTSSDKIQSISDSKKQNDTNSPEITFGCFQSDSANFQSENMSEVELFNNFEDDCFDDELILSKPEVLSWIDEVENKLSQNLKCTPEEIEKKKDEAIQRRKKKQSQNKN